jgi:hypothetical protein
MKFNHPQDTKAFLIGMLASVSAVIIWDVVKYNSGLLEYKYEK